MPKQISEGQLNRMSLHGGKVTRQQKPQPAPAAPEPPPSGGSMSKIIEATQMLVNEVADQSRKPPPARDPLLELLPRRMHDLQQSISSQFKSISDRHESDVAQLRSAIDNDLQQSISSQLRSISERHESDVAQLRSAIDTRPAPPTAPAKSKQPMQLKVVRIAGQGIIQRVVTSTGLVFTFNRTSNGLVDTIDMAYHAAGDGK